MSEKNNQDDIRQEIHIQQGGSANVSINNYGEQNIKQKFPTEKQPLAKAAEEIQNLLIQLEKTNPSATLAQKKAFVDIAIPPTIKQRAKSALQAGIQSSIEEFLDNPYVNVGMAIIEGWREEQQNNSADC
ncbi:pentapeptide repeat-containing protein [Leptolyngbya sp. Heron Island J]|uniref:hypothetical protein n=1 Tax=Leptolyngbya sp. Heron Island J TaxID=1385935 RepID=UPI0003B99BF2|nr:hypothetical protein [Leptolyngbya sp. Heron Island J]ESA33824.1 pentapeptide repeat-containing protein [Leptolyngbya sp. Heron Island J]